MKLEPKQDAAPCTILNDSFEEEVKAFLIAEDQLHQYDDLTKVNPVTTKTVLKCLEARYQAGVFYTCAGCTLVAINPFQPVCHLYSPEVMKEYHTALQPRELKPHIFIVAEQAYRNVQGQIEPIDQSIIVSGESGAGKTWTSRCLMRYYATVAASSSSQKRCETVERIEKRVLESNPVMEAFGNARTLRNNNSSRFGKYIQLQLDRSQQLVGASIQTYLLEKTRVVYHAPSERNFHIFYQLMKGANEEERLEWTLPLTAGFCWLPNSEQTLEEDCFETTKEAMLHLGIDSLTQKQIFRVLAGLLHLGNVQFVDPVDESQPCELTDDTKDFIEIAASLLKVPEKLLLEQLRIRTITAGKQHQVFKKPCPKTECITRRDCLAKLIYAKLFDWLVMVINGSICTDSSKWINFIGLLDVYGFESFPQNNLEQLCINYTNEKLQQHFVAHYLKAQQEEYEVEGLEWSFVSYQDNQSCLDLIEGSPTSIFSLLNEECRLNRPSDASQFQTRIEKALSSNKCVSWDKFSQIPNFAVSHYAGKVSYQIEGMTEKNKDPVPPELIQLLQRSWDTLLQKLFPVEERGEQEDARAYSKGVTVVSKFKSSLESLMGILLSNTPHYIRCIKPNTNCKPMDFKKEEVLCQLEACGIVETINISAAGFPIRVPYQSFVERYGVMIKPHRSTLNQGSYGNSCSPAKRKRGLDDMGVDSETLSSTAHAILRELMLEQSVISSFHNRAETKNRSTLVHCGKTKVFMTHTVLELLESARMNVLSQMAFRIQRCWKMYKHRKQDRERQAATIIQAAVRSWSTRRRIQKLRSAAAMIQKAWRRWKVRMAALAMAELDDTEDDMEQHVGSVPGSPVRPTKTFYNFPPSTSVKASCKPLFQNEVVIHSWPVGLVVLSAPIRVMAVMIDHFHRVLSLLACLKVLRCTTEYRVQPNQFNDGIASIRALPQGSIRFHCGQSPLLFANICPKESNKITGFNQILLEKA
nr:PREDICTED: unconventional myosin-XIX isoform X2 [Latimeria chalumnae]|eukprot:XP_014343082.1 PREDICTED: unconventional myosin-XIX isoform X2 [Latimeria chalumnae]